jgi:hypothetical protein
MLLLYFRSRFFLRPSLNGTTESFNEGFAVIKSHGKYDFIDQKGDMSITPQFDNANSFIKGMARVRLNNY